MPASLAAVDLEARLEEEARFAAVPGLALAGRGLTLAAAELDLESAAPVADRLARALAAYVRPSSVIKSLWSMTKLSNTEAVDLPVRISLDLFRAVSKAA